MVEIKEDTFFNLDLDILSVCKKQANQKLWTETETLAKSIKDIEIQAEALAYLSIQLAKDQRMQEAELIIDSIIDFLGLIPISYEKIYALFEIVKIWEALGEENQVINLLVKAETIACSMKGNSWQKAECLCRIAKILANYNLNKSIVLLNKAIEIAQAARLIDDKQDKQDSIGVLWEIRAFLISIGHLKKAKEVEALLTNETR